jgi:hypothetical protein
MLFDRMHLLLFGGACKRAESNMHYATSLFALKSPVSITAMPLKV